MAGAFPPPSFPSSLKFPKSAIAKSIIFQRPKIYSIKGSALDLCYMRKLTMPMIRGMKAIKALGQARVAAGEVCAIEDSTNAGPHSESTV